MLVSLLKRLAEATENAEYEVRDCGFLAVLVLLPYILMWAAVCFGIMWCFIMPCMYPPSSNPTVAVVLGALAADLLGSFFRYLASTRK